MQVSVTPVTNFWRPEHKAYMGQPGSHIISEPQIIEHQKPLFLESSAELFPDEIYLFESRQTYFLHL